MDGSLVSDQLGDGGHSRPLCRRNQLAADIIGWDEWDGGNVRDAV